MRRTEKYASLRSILHSKSSCSRRNFRKCRPSILKCSKGINLLRFFKFIPGWFPPFLFSTKKRLLRNCPYVGTISWIAPFSNISKISCSTNGNCSFDILSILVFSPQMGDLQMGFRTPLQQIKLLDSENFFLRLLLT